MDKVITAIFIAVILAGCDDSKAVFLKQQQECIIHGMTLYASSSYSIICSDSDGRLYEAQKLK